MKPKEDIITLPYSGETYSLREPKGKDLRELANTLKGKNEVESVYVLIEALSTPSITVEQLDEMDAEDVTALMLAVKSKRAFNMSNQAKQ